MSPSEGGNHGVPPGALDLSSKAQPDVDKIVTQLLTGGESALKDLDPAAMRALLCPAPGASDHSGLIGAFWGDLGQAKLAYKTMHYVRAVRTRIKALASSLAPPDPPEGTILKVIKGHFVFSTPGTKDDKTGFRLLVFAPRTLDPKTVVDSAPVLLDGVKSAYVSSGGYSAVQYPQTMCPDTLFICLRGLGQVLRILHRCYSNGFDEFVHRLDALRCHLIGRFDITWDFVTRVFKEMSELMFTFLHLVGDGVLPSWNAWSPSLEEHYALLLTNQGQLQKLRPIQVTSAREDVPSSLPSGNPFTLFPASFTASSDAVVISQLQQTTELLVSEIAALKSSTPPAIAGVPGGGTPQGGAKKGKKTAAQRKAAQAAKAANPPARSPTPAGGGASGGGSAKSTKLKVDKWIQNPELKHLCFKFHVSGTCTASPCPNNRTHGSLSAAQKAAAGVH